MGNIKKLELIVKYSREEKKLYISDHGEHEVVPYDFMFEVSGQHHFMVFSKNLLYAICLGGEVRTARLKLFPGDKLMILEDGYYEYQEVIPCPARSLWLQAYSNWLAEKELLGG